MNEHLVAVIGRLVATLPDGALDTLEHVLRETTETSAVVSAVPSDIYREHARALVHALRQAGADGTSVALAVAAAREAA